MLRKVLPLIVASALSGCTAATAPLGLAVAGAGTSAALTHTLNGAAQRTFTAPLSEVKVASLAALEAMGIRLESTGTVEENELIVANAERRRIEIELEPISARTTRVKVSAKNGGIFYDAATATEIVLQTEKYLPQEVTNSAAGGSGRRWR
jgi:hypothetical protein